MDFHCFPAGVRPKGGPDPQPWKGGEEATIPTVLGRRARMGTPRSQRRGRVNGKEQAAMPEKGNQAGGTRARRCPACVEEAVWTHGHHTAGRCLAPAHYSSVPIHQTPAERPSPSPRLGAPCAPPAPTHGARHPMSVTTATSSFVPAGPQPPALHQAHVGRISKVLICKGCLSRAPGTSEASLWCPTGALTLVTWSDRGLLCNLPTPKAHMKGLGKWVHFGERGFS